MTRRMVSYRLNMPRLAGLTVGAVLTFICFSVSWVIDPHSLVAGLIAVLCAQAALVVADRIWLRRAESSRERDALGDAPQGGDTRRIT
jgi:uncharacterized membrane protein